jgi:hypothetical protein
MADSFTKISVRSGHAPHELRSYVADRKRGCDGYPRLAANEVTKIEIESLFLDILLRRSKAILNRVASSFRSLTTLIHCLAHGGVCGIFICHRWHLITLYIIRLHAIASPARSLMRSTRRFD